MKRKSKLPPLAQSGLTLLAVAILLALFLAFRYQMVQGRFQSVANIHPSVCRTIAASLPGVQDFALDTVRGQLLIAASNQGAPGAGDGIYRLKLNDPGAAPAKIAGGTDIHPAGLDYARGPDGGETLGVIDRKPNGVALVETFSLAATEAIRLSPQTTVRGGILTAPSDLALIAPNAFYLANAHVATNKAGRFAEDYLLWPHADVLAFNGMGFHIAVQRLTAPSGVVARGRLLYVTARNGRALHAFSREDFTGNLTKIGKLSVPARLDKITLDALGNLILAGQAKPGTAQVYRVKLGQDGVPVSYETLFSDDGGMLKGASVAALANGHLFIGSAQDSKILDCVVK